MAITGIKDLLCPGAHEAVATGVTIECVMRTGDNVLTSTGHRSDNCHPIYTAGGPLFPALDLYKCIKVTPLCVRTYVAGRFT